MLSRGISKVPTGSEACSLGRKYYSEVLGRRVQLIVELRIEEEQFQGSWKGPVRLPANLHVLCGSGDPQRSYDQVPREILWEVLGVYRVRGSLLRAIQRL